MAAWRSSLVWVMMALSSAYWSSSIVKWEINVLALSRRKLKSLPSIRYCISMPRGSLSDTKYNTADMNIEKSVGAKTHPFFTPVFTSKLSVASPSIRTDADMLSCSNRTSLMYFSGQPILDNSSHNVGRSTESNALARSMKTMQRSLCCSLHFFWICRAEKIISTVPRAGLKPHCDSGRTSSAIGVRRHARIRVKIFPATESKEIPR